MGILNIVIALLLLLGGLKFVASPLFNSILSMRIDGFDYRILPSLGCGIIITIIVVAKIMANAATRHKQADHHEQGPQRPRVDDRNN